MKGGRGVEDATAPSLNGGSGLELKKIPLMDLSGL